MAELDPWHNTMDVDDIAHPGLDLGAELGFGAENGDPMSLDGMGPGHGDPLSLDGLGPLPGLGDSLGAELGGDSLNAELQGGTLGAELGGSLGDELLGYGHDTNAEVMGTPGLPDARNHAQSHTSLSAELDLDSPQASGLSTFSQDHNGAHDLSSDAQASFEARLQATHAQTLALLSDTIQHTDAFLAKLRPPMGQASVEEDIQKLEATAATVVRQLQETAIQREAQVRELKEAQLVLDVFEPPAAKQPVIADPPAQPEMTPAAVPAPLSITSSVPDVAAGPHWVPRKASGVDLDEDDQLIESSLLSAGGDGDDLLGLGRSEDQTLAASPSTRRAVLRGDKAADLPHSTRGQVGIGMAAVRDTTSDLLSGLAAMNEHTQVHRAAFNDLSRKFRGLRGALTQIVSEASSTQQSIDWLTAWHERQQADYSAPIPTKDKADTRSKDNDAHAGLVAWMSTVRNYMDHALVDAEAKAHKLLQPPPPPPSIADMDLSQVALPVSKSVVGQA